MARVPCTAPGTFSGGAHHGGETAWHGPLFPPRGAGDGTRRGPAPCLDLALGRAWPAAAPAARPGAWGPEVPLVSRGGAEIRRRWGDRLSTAGSARFFGGLGDGCPPAPSLYRLRFNNSAGTMVIPGARPDGATVRERGAGNGPRPFAFHQGHKIPGRHKCRHFLPFFAGVRTLPDRRAIRGKKTHV